MKVEVANISRQESMLILQARKKSNCVQRRTRKLSVQRVQKDNDYFLGRSSPDRPWEEGAAFFVWGCRLDVSVATIPYCVVIIKWRIST